jgi:thiamine-monophosphate kinase
MGAKPAGILISTVMPNDMPTGDYRRFWDGVVDASDAWHCRVLGGNIKDGQKFSSEGAAFGWCADRSVMSRSGSSDGDLAYVVGDMGSFWAAILNGLRAPDLPLTDAERTLAKQALTHPSPRINEGRLLAASGMVTGCMDASDGVLGALIELGRVNKLDVYLTEPKPTSLVDKVASRLGIPPLKLMLSWGDWQLVTTIHEESRCEFEALAHSFSTPVTLIGKMKPGSGCVQSQSDGPVRQLANLSSERFTRTSYFTSGIQQYIDWFIDAPQFVD